MALKRGPIIPGAEAYTAHTIVPNLTALLATGNAGGADVSATLYLPNGVNTGITALDQPYQIDYRIYFVYWDKAWTGGNVTIKPYANGAVMSSGTYNLTIAPQAGAGYTYKVLPPGAAAIGHGDTHGFNAAAAVGFTCTGNLSLTVYFSGSPTVQPNFAAHTPS